MGHYVFFMLKQNPFSDLLLFSYSVMSDSLLPHKLQHTRLSCPSPSPGVCSNSCPLMPYNHLILCCFLLLLPSVFPSIRVFSNESTLCIRWPKYWCFTFSITVLNCLCLFFFFSVLTLAASFRRKVQFPAFSDHCL